MKALKNFGVLNDSCDNNNVHDQQQQQQEQTGPVHFFVHSSPKCGRPRTRSSTTIWNLPDSVIVDILTGLHVRDLLNFKTVHPYFHDLIEDNVKTLWGSVSFFDCWPGDSNLIHFVKASENGNVEATIKLAVAYLYKEGVTQEDATKIAQLAANYLKLAEAQTPNTFPFFWIFIRPPWALDGECSKLQAFKYIRQIVDSVEEKDKDLAFGVALTLKLHRLSLQGICKMEEQRYFEIAAKAKSAAATFFSTLEYLPVEDNPDQDFERIRLLRGLSAGNVLEAKINLIRNYIQGQYGGITEGMAKDFAQKFFRSSKPSGIHSTFTNGQTSDISRYILVDWLVEVVGMKDFSAHTLYLAVSLFDRFLNQRSVQRSQVQLLGVAAMVVSSRFLGFDILTIREAAWLTDNSYTYHDVVRMMGELVATLKGNIRVVTIQDYVKTLLVVTGEGGYMTMLVEYIAMLCLLQSEMGQYSPAEIAASCVLLSRLLHNKDDPWPDCLKEWTGFSQDYLSLCTFHIHKKCLLEGSEVDYRETKLQAVKLRYEDANRCSVSNIEVIGHRELCRRLGVTKLVNHGKNTKSIRFRNTDELIVSPRRGKKHPEFLKSLNQSFEEDVVDRTNAATPPIKHANVFEDSINGYYGDLEEDSDDSDNLYELTGDSDLDHSTTFDHGDESHYWDSELSIIEGETSDTENESSGIFDKTGSDVKSKGKMVCLSSMCHSGQKVKCQGSCCISNCSCKITLTFVGVHSFHKISGEQSSHSQKCARNSSSQSSPSSSSTSQTSSSTSSAPSSSTCDTQPPNNCDDNDNNHAQPTVVNGSVELSDDLIQGLNSIYTPGSKCSYSVEGNVESSCAKSYVISINNDHSSQKVNVLKKSCANSSFIEISCGSSSSSFSPSSSHPSSCSDDKGAVDGIGSARTAGLRSTRKENHLAIDVALSTSSQSGEEQKQERQFSSFPTCSSLDKMPCCSDSNCLHEISATPTSSLDGSHFTQSAYTFCSHDSHHPDNSENKEYPSVLSVTPSNHFMSAKRARLDQPSSSSSSTSSTSPPTLMSHYRVSRTCCNSFTDLLGQSGSSLHSDKTEDGSKRFSLPSRLKRKKASCP